MGQLELQQNIFIYCPLWKYFGLHFQIYGIIWHQLGNLNFLYFKTLHKYVHKQKVCKKRTAVSNVPYILSQKMDK